MSGIICLFLTLFLCLCLCMPSPHALFLPGVMELHEVDATLALSLSLSTLNHIYSAQSKPLIRAVEIQTDLCETVCRRALPLTLTCPYVCVYKPYRPVNACVHMCYPSHSLEVHRAVCMSFYIFRPISGASEDFCDVKMRGCFFFQFFQ